VKEIISVVLIGRLKKQCLGLHYARSQRHQALSHFVLFLRNFTHIIPAYSAGETRVVGHMNLLPQFKIHTAPPPSLPPPAPPPPSRRFPLPVRLNWYLAHRCSSAGLLHAGCSATVQGFAFYLCIVCVLWVFVILVFYVWILKCCILVCPAWDIHPGIILTTILNASLKASLKELLNLLCFKICICFLWEYKKTRCCVCIQWDSFSNADMYKEWLNTIYYYLSYARCLLFPNYKNAQIL